MTSFSAVFKTHKVLILILLVAFLLRVVDINKNPLYGDELTLVYDSFSLLKTGHDSTGSFLPITFEMGEGRPGGYVYGSIPFVALFGPTALGVRSLSILSGLGIIVLMYLLGKKLFKKEVGLFSAAVAAFIPWDISLSRAGFEAHFALFLVLFGVVVLIYGSKWKHYLWAAIAFGITLHTYPTYKVVLPIFLVLLFWFLKFRLTGFFERKVWSGLIVFIVLAMISLTQTFTAGSETRFSSLNLFSKSDVTQQLLQKLNDERNNEDLPEKYSALFHNKPIAYGQLFLNSYLENFSPAFLFVSGDGIPTHNPATSGELFFAQIFLIFLGIGFLFWEKKKTEIIFLLGWLAIAPISTAFLIQTHALRSAFMIPPLILLSGLGCFWLWQKRKLLFGKAAILIIFLIFVVQFFFFADELYFVSPNRLSDFWSFPAKKASEVAIKSSGKFDYIVMSNSIENIRYAYPVYAKIDPKSVQHPTSQNLGGVEFNKYGNVLIGDVTHENVKQFLSSVQGSILLISDPDFRPALVDVPSIQFDKDLLWVSQNK